MATAASTFYPTYLSKEEVLQRGRSREAGSQDGSIKTGQEVERKPSRKLVAARDQDVGVTRAQKEALERPQPTRRTDEGNGTFRSSECEKRGPHRWEPVADN